MDLKVVCQKNEAIEKNAPGSFIHCRRKNPGTNRLKLVTIRDRARKGYCYCVGRRLRLARVRTVNHT